jgi:hypothetical protein
LHVDAPPVQPHQFLDHGQADAAAFDGPPDSSRHTVEPLEQARQFLGGNADARIADGQHHLAGIEPGQLDRDGARVRVLERIRQQVQHHRFPHLAIHRHGRWQRGAIDLQPHAGRFHGRAEQRGQVGGKGRQVGRLRRHLHAPGLDARKIQQRIHQLQQPLAIAMGDFRQRAIALRHIAAT